MMQPDTCALYQWSIQFEATDDESGIYAFDTFPEVENADFNIEYSNTSFATGSYS